MSNFYDTDAGAEFIATANSRNTSPEIMEAIAFLARNAAEAEAIWEGDRLGESELLAIWEHATGNGFRDASALFWGAAGNDWAQHICPRYIGITPQAHAVFEEWLTGVLKHPENAERHADALIAQQDWSASTIIEVSGFHTASGNPITYYFGPDEMITESCEA